MGNCETVFDSFIEYIYSDSIFLCDFFVDFKAFKSKLSARWKTTKSHCPPVYGFLLQFDCHVIFSNLKFIMICREQRGFPIAYSCIASALSGSMVVACCTLLFALVYFFTPLLNILELGVASCLLLDNLRSCCFAHRVVHLCDDE